MSLPKTGKIEPCDDLKVKIERTHVIKAPEKGESEGYTFYKVEMDSTGKEVLPQGYLEVGEEDIEMLGEGLEAKGDSYRKDWRDLFKHDDGFCKDKENKVYSFRTLLPFPNCSPPTGGDLANGKISLSAPLSEEASIYLASEFPSSETDGCSSATSEGVWNKIKPDHLLIESAIAKIRKDIADKKLPSGLDEKKANEIIGELEKVLKVLDRQYIESSNNLKTQLDASKRALEQQLDAQQKNMDRMLYIQVGSTAVMSLFFGLQLVMSAKMMKQNQDMVAEQVGKGKGALEKYGIDLVEKARKGELSPVDMSIRASELKNTIMNLLRDKSVALTGIAGVGKTAFVEGLAALIAKEAIPQLKGTKIFAIEVADLIAGTSFRGQFELRLRSIIQAAAKMRKSGTRVIIFIDEFHTIMGAGGTQGSPLDVSNIIKPPLARGELVIIGATTLEEFIRFIRDGALKRRFSKVDLSEFTAEQTIPALKAVAKKISAAIKGVSPEMRIGDAVIAKIVELAPKYLPDVARPSNAIELLGQAVASVRFDNPDAVELTVEAVLKAFEEYKVGNGEAADGPPKINAEQARSIWMDNLSKVMKQNPALIGIDITPDIVEYVYDKLSNMSLEQRLMASENPQVLNRAIARFVLEKVAANKDGSNKDPRGPNEPPSAGATAAPAGATADDAEASPVVDDSDDNGWRFAGLGVIRPLTTGAAVMAEDGFGRTMWDVMAERAMMSLAPAQEAVAVGADGKFYMVSVGEAVETAPVLRGNPVRMLSPEQQTELGAYSGTGLRTFANLGVGGFVGGAGALTIIHAYEDSGRGEMPWYGEAGTFLGTCTATSLGMASLNGEPLVGMLNPSSLIGGAFVGLPASVTTFTSASYVGDMAGLEHGTRENEWFTVGTGSLLVAGAMTAEVGSWGSAAAAGISWGALGLSTLGGIAVGCAALTGGGIGLGIDHGLGAAGVESSDGDKTFSGWIAELAFRVNHPTDPDDYAAKLGSIAGTSYSF